MSLSGSEARQIWDALSQYLTAAELKRLFRFDLDRNLENVAFGKNKDDLVLSVVDYVERHGLLQKLAHGAVRINPNPKLRIALGPWLSRDGKDEPLHPDRLRDDYIVVVPCWALSHAAKVQIVRGFKRRQVSTGTVPSSLRNAFSRSLDKEDSRNIIRETNTIRCGADPEFADEAITLYGLGNFDVVGEHAYWNNAFDKACQRGGRLLGSLLLATPPDIYEANKETILDILDRLKEGQP